MSPKIHLTAFNDRQGKFIFVAVPDESGRYLRTSKAVALVGCPWCKSIAGEPCKGRNGYTGMTHAVRENLRKQKHGIRPDGDDVIHPRTGPIEGNLPEDQEWT